jgi:hypothetical protein
MTATLGTTEPGSSPATGERVLIVSSDGHAMAEMAVPTFTRSAVTRTAVI